MRRFNKKIFVLLSLCFFLPLTQAYAAAMDFLASSDVRALEGNAVFESALRELEKELDAAAEAFARELRPDFQVLFDDNQMDWKSCFIAEELAFKPADVWTKGGQPGERYENLYQQNVLFALDFRKKQIEAFRDQTARPPRNEYDDERKKILTAEIEEAHYRVNAWTEERMRPRLYRAGKAWETYRASLTKFAETLGWDQTRIAEQDFALMEYRYALLSRQREALFRLKSETEE